MIEEHIEKILSHLPEQEREEARYRITRANLDGVEHIGLWDHIDPDTGDFAVNVDDLVGNCPRYREELRAKGDNSSSGLIFLSKYASQ